MSTSRKLKRLMRVAALVQTCTLAELREARDKAAARAFAVNGTRWDLTKYEDLDDAVKMAEREEQP